MLRISHGGSLRPALLLFLLAPGCLNASHAQEVGQPRLDVRSANILRMQQKLAEFWREGLDFVGAKEDSTQTAIVGELVTRHQSLVPINIQVRNLVVDLTRPEVSDEQIKTLLADVRSSLDKEKKRRSEAVVNLDARIHYSNNARLETLLTYLGIIGDDAGTLDSVPQSLLHLHTDSVVEALGKLNVTDSQVVGNVLAYVYQQERLFKPVIDEIHDNETDVKTGDRKPTEEENRQRLSAFHQHVAQLQKRQKSALAKLDARIGYSRNPRLRAALFVMGVLDSDISLIDDINLHGITQYRRSRNIVTG